MTKHEHGTMRSYVIGFVLSLIFTAIPYYLVVNHTITGNALLAAIMGFAVTQMIIQITFFLHLGRGPKPNWNFFFFASTVGIILIVVGGSIVIINNLHYNMQPSDQTKKLIANEGIYQVEGQKTGACQQILVNHVVTISNGKVTPLHTMARLCDTLTFINQDSAPRVIAFGAHLNHETYAGVSELPVSKRRNQTITLNQLGTYQFHDHLDSLVSGDFMVMEQ